MCACSEVRLRNPPSNFRVRAPCNSYGTAFTVGSFVHSSNHAFCTLVLYAYKRVQTETLMFTLVTKIVSGIRISLSLLRGECKVLEEYDSGSRLISFLKATEFKNCIHNVVKTVNGGKAFHLFTISSVVVLKLNIEHFSSYHTGDYCVPYS
jgi:hypothetical protein